MKKFHCLLYHFSLATLTLTPFILVSAFIPISFWDLFFERAFSLFVFIYQSTFWDNRNGFGRRVFLFKLNQMENQITVNYGSQKQKSSIEKQRIDRRGIKFSSFCTLYRYLGKVNFLSYTYNRLNCEEMDFDSYYMSAIVTDVVLDSFLFLFYSFYFGSPFICTQCTIDRFDFFYL